MKSKLLGLIGLAFVASTAPGQIPTNGLMAHYPFAGNANDAVGTLNGTPNGATLTADRFGNASKAYYFNGSAAVEFPNPPITATDNWTVSVWAKLETLNQEGVMVIVGYDNAINFGNGYEFGVGEGGTASDKLLAAFGGLAFIPTGYVFTSTNVWYHVVMRRAGGETRFFVNAVMTSGSTLISPATPTDFTIGSVNNGRYFRGSLDEVRVYGRALTDTEVQQLYQAEATENSLPVRLVNFTAAPTAEGGTVLNWQTTWERNTMRFEIERSLNSLEAFGPVASVSAIGTTDQRQYYHFVDAYPPVGINYYRLRQVDTDGSVDYSRILSVTVADGQPMLQLLQNPVADAMVWLRLRHYQAADLSLTTASGVPVAVQTTTCSDETVVLRPVRPLPVGIYFITARRNGLRGQVRLVWQP